MAKHVSDYAHDIEEAIVTAYAEALAGTATYYNTNACWAWTGVEGCIISEDNPDGTCASCEASAVGDTFIQEIDAIATASAPPPQFSTARYPWIELLRNLLGLCFWMSDRTILIPTLPPSRLPGGPLPPQQWSASPPRLFYLKF